MKTIPYSSSEEAIQMVEEAMILKELKHPNIVRYLSSWKEDIPAEERDSRMNTGFLFLIGLIHPTRQTQHQRIHQLGIFS